MKTLKIIAVLLSLSLAFALASCGGGNTNTADDDAPLTRSDNTPATSAPQGGEQMPAIPDFASVMTGTAATDTVWGLQSAATQQEIINSAKANGYDVSFGSDGSMTVKSEDGTVAVQNADGSWTVKEADGSSAQLGGSWPDNEFTRLVPAPDFAMTGSSSSDSEFTAAFRTATIEQIKAYVEAVKAKGFTVEPEVVDQNALGIVVYTYSASNADGYSVEITFASGTSGITIRK